MLPWLFALNPLLGTPAHAVDVEVRYLGFVQVYRVQPGESIADTWYGVPLPEEAGRRRVREDRRPDVHVKVMADTKGKDALYVKVELDRELDGEITAVSHPEMLVPTSNPVGRMQVGKQVALVDEAKSAGHRVRFRKLNKPEVEVTVVPDGMLTDEVITPPGD